MNIMHYELSPSSASSSATIALVTAALVAGLNVQPFGMDTAVLTGTRPWAACTWPSQSHHGQVQNPMCELRPNL